MSNSNGGRSASPMRHKSALRHDFGRAAAKMVQMLLPLTLPLTGLASLFEVCAMCMKPLPDNLIFRLKRPQTNVAPRPPAPARSLPNETEREPAHLSHSLHNSPSIERGSERPIWQFPARNFVHFGARSKICRHSSDRAGGPTTEDRSICCARRRSEGGNKRSDKMSIEF